MLELCHMDPVCMQALLPWADKMLTYVLCRGLRAETWGIAMIPAIITMTAMDMPAKMALL